MDLKEDLKAGDEITIQIAPFGEYPAESVGGVQLVEVFDREGFEKIIENWKADGAKLVRADFDHKSEMTDNTVASGWLKDLFIDDDKGLMGTLVVSESGASALNGLDYRFGSPVFVLDDANKPTHLLSYAFTNRPRLKDMDAVYNSEKPATQDVVNVDGKQEQVEESQNVNINVTETIKEKNMDELKVILGLPPEATDEDVKASVKEMVEKLKAIADEEIAVEAEEAVNECGIEEDKKEEVMNCYKQNPQLVKSVLNCFKKTPVKMVVNAEEAVKPELTDAEKLKREYAALKGGKDKVDFLKAHPSITL